MPKDILKTTNFKYVSAGKGIADNLKALESPDLHLKLLDPETRVFS